MRAAQIILTLAGSAILASCGQPLGEYEIEAIDVTDGAPMPLGVRSPSYGQFLRIELSSEISLTAISDNIDGVYAHADFCPFSDSYSLSTFGPFSSDNTDLGVPSSAQPLQRGPDGKFHYNVFIVPAHPMPGVTYSKSALEREPYDIWADGRDVCLKFDAPGYNIFPSESRMIRISYEQIEAARPSSK
jgi:hypothetical protein